MYLGLTPNPKHTELLQARLDMLVIKELVQEDHPQYSPELHAALLQGGVQGGAGNPKNPRPGRAPAEAVARAVDASGLVAKQRRRARAAPGMESPRAQRGRPWAGGGLLQ